MYALADSIRTWMVSVIDMIHIFCLLSAAEFNVDYVDVFSVGDETEIPR